MMPLTMAKPGETVTIRRITGRDGGLRRDGGGRSRRKPDPASAEQPGGTGPDHGRPNFILRRSAG